MARPSSAGGSLIRTRSERRSRTARRTIRIAPTWRATRGMWGAEKAFQGVRRKFNVRAQRIMVRTRINVLRTRITRSPIHDERRRGQRPSRARKAVVHSAADTTGMRQEVTFPNHLEQVAISRLRKEMHRVAPCRVPDLPSCQQQMGVAASMRKRAVLLLDRSLVGSAGNKVSSNWSETPAS